jgi:hypothetical protein
VRPLCRRLGRISDESRVCGERPARARSEIPVRDPFAACSEGVPQKSARIRRPPLILIYL